MLKIIIGIGLILALALVLLIVLYIAIIKLEKDKEKFNQSTKVYDTIVRDIEFNNNIKKEENKNEYD